MDDLPLCFVADAEDEEQRRGEEEVVPILHPPPHQTLHREQLGHHELGEAGQVGELLDDVVGDGRWQQVGEGGADPELQQHTQPKRVPDVLLASVRIDVNRLAQLQHLSHLM